jgi:hypothetical protein
MASPEICTTLKDNRFGVPVNRALRRIFRPEREEVTRGWRKLYSEELRNLYSALNIIRVRM